PVHGVQAWAPVRASEECCLLAFEQIERVKPLGLFLPTPLDPRHYSQTRDFDVLPGCVEFLAQAVHWDPFGARWGRDGHWPLLLSVGHRRYRSQRMKRDRHLRKREKAWAKTLAAKAAGPPAAAAGDAAQWRWGPGAAQGAALAAPAGGKGGQRRSRRPRPGSKGASGGLGTDADAEDTAGQGERPASKGARPASKGARPGSKGRCAGSKGSGAPGKGAKGGAAGRGRAAGKPSAAAWPCARGASPAAAPA
ncbi:MAG: hypothetical protein GY772_07085, partial [bacterium]|nr:hypothetical protein [bacterium]